MPSLDVLWQILDIFYTASYNQVIITITSDAPCHLWCRLTRIQPQKHPIPEYRRGVWFNSEIYFCFDSYWDIEQNEPGDTTSHSFTITDWPYCTTLWFYFWGERAGVPSPSESCVFKYHQLYQQNYGPTQFITCYSQSGQGGVCCDGLIYNTVANSSFLTIRNGTGVLALPSYQDMWVYIRSDGPSGTWNSIARSIINFNTTAIPSGSLIVSAALTINNVKAAQELPVNSYWAVFSASPALVNRLTTADFSCCGDTPVSDLRTLPNNWGYGSLSFDLNSYGLSLVTPSGVSSFGIRDASFDAPGVIPSWSADDRNGLVFGAADNPTSSKRPRLYVGYKEPI